MLAWQWAGITTPNPAKLNVKAMLDIFMMTSARKDKSSTEVGAPR